MLCVISAACWIEAQAYGANNNHGRRYAYVKLNGVAVWQASWFGEFPNRRGANVIVVDPANCTMQEWHNFDTFRSKYDCVRLHHYLRRLSIGTVLVGVSCDEASNQLRCALPILRAFGADVSDVGYRGAWAFVAEKGDPSKTVLDKELTETAANRRQPKVNTSIAGAYSAIYCSNS